MEIELGLTLDIGQKPPLPKSMTFSFSLETSDEVSKESTSSVDATLEMPEDSQLSVSILRREYDQKIPYKSVIEKTYVDGTKAYTYVTGRGGKIVPCIRIWIKISYHIFNFRSSRYKFCTCIDFNF